MAEECIDLAQVVAMGKVAPPTKAEYIRRTTKDKLMKHVRKAINILIEEIRAMPDDKDWNLKTGIISLYYFNVMYKEEAILFYQDAEVRDEVLRYARMRLGPSIRAVVMEQASSHETAWVTYTPKLSLIVGTEVMIPENSWPNFETTMYLSDKK